MNNPPSRAEFDALANLAGILSQGQDSTTGHLRTLEAMLHAARTAQDLLAEEIRRQGAELQTMRAVVIVLLQQGSPHLPPPLQGGVAAALQSLAAAPAPQ